MEEFISNETIKERLLAEGLTELEIHGFADFSLRRVASKCNVSCAAPYKHFKDKNDFINAIICYVDNQWTALLEQIKSVFEDDQKRQLMEACIAFVRFCTGNSQFRSILMMNLGSKKANLNMIQSIADLMASYFENDAQKVFKIQSLVLGTVTMTDNDTNNNETKLNMLRHAIENEI
ncbi:MAG: TetR/AcrR family transcriptional regulator [Clostridia bacterium]|nr:TetR/AcrR family transcriptional regulator [Clostridia bacterium]